MALDARVDLGVVVVDDAGADRDMSTPLDLRAVEARLVATEVCYECRADMQALLVHCRALRAALRAFLDLPYPVESPEVVDTLRRAAAVLAQATDSARDEEAPGEA